MTIENPSEYLRNLWDWAILDGCFGETRIKPTDIDGFVERNGYFLAIETKAAGVEVKQGQMIVFNKLIETGKFTVLVIWGKPGKPEKMLLITRKETKEYSGGMDSLRFIVSKWFQYANSKH